MIEVQQLGKRFSHGRGAQARSVQALDGVSFSARDGQTLSSTVTATAAHSSSSSGASAVRIPLIAPPSPSPAPPSP